MLASLLPTGAVSALAYAQTIYLLPVSLFGMSITASELPAMSALNGSQEEINLALRKRLDSGLHRIAFFIVPSVCASSCSSLNQIMSLTQTCTVTVTLSASLREI